MSNVDDLIKKYSSKNVLFTALKNVIKITIGEFVHKNRQSKDGKYPVYNGGINPTGYYDDYNNTGFKIIISARGANAGYINKIEKNYWAGNSCYSLEVIDDKNINYNFIYYYLKSHQNKFTEQQQKGGIPAISKKQVEELIIPIPPLSVQEEIVNILDKFTSLTAELEAELEARRTQYVYYRDKLLGFENSDVEWKTLGEVVKMKRGVRVVKSELDSTHGYPVYQNSLKPMGYFGRYNSEPNTTFIITAGSAGEVGFSSINFWSADDCFTFICPIFLNDKFVYYYLMVVQNYLFSMVRKASVPRLSRTIIEKIKIPIPPREEQDRIVAILDKFDALVTDISTGLPAEIKARRQQYEYYRAKLLTFN
jgi:type I restriction enzyme S subunit